MVTISIPTLEQKERLSENDAIVLWKVVVSQLSGALVLSRARIFSRKPGCTRPPAAANTKAHHATPGSLLHFLLKRQGIICQSLLVGLKPRFDAALGKV